MTKIEGPGSASGSGSISQRHGSGSTPKCHGKGREGRPRQPRDVPYGRLSTVQSSFSRVPCFMGSSGLQAEYDKCASQCLGDRLLITGPSQAGFERLPFLLLRCMPLQGAWSLAADSTQVTDSGIGPDPHLFESISFPSLVGHSYCNLMLENANCIYRNWFQDSFIRHIEPYANVVETLKMYIRLSCWFSYKMTIQFLKTYRLTKILT